VGTPGRIIDMCERGNLKLDKIKTVVLDEADKMLTMGFQEQIEDIFKKIYDVKKEKEVQVCLFSATIQPWVKQVAMNIMNNREHVFIDLVKNLENKTPKTVQHLSVQCLKSERVTSIADLILCYGGKNKSTIVFVNTKNECNSLMISEKIKQEVQIIHGDINQRQREATIEGFKKGKFKCLVATDVASRGLDIPSVDLIIQSEPPKDVDTYIHRAGRTARAGREGVCITLYTKIQEDLLKRITKQAKIQFKKVGAPQREDIIDSNLRDITHSIEKVDGSIKTLFGESAKKLVATYGAEEAVSRLLAIVSGHTEKLKSRSVLCGAEGYITYLVKTTKEFTHLGYIWGILKKLSADKITSQIRGMKQFKNKMGAVFDILEEHSSEFEEVLFNDRFYGHNYTLEKATSTLPELVEDYKAGNGTMNGGSHNTRNGNGHNGHWNSANGHSRDSSKKRDRANRKDIFVGNLSFDTTKEDIENLLVKNDIKGDAEVRIAVDNDTGKSKGFGFVSVYEEDLFNKVLQLNGKKVRDRVLRINSANK
jgi:ATP-dependent RNA helicase DDX21